MKKLTVLLFSILISFSSYGEWKKVANSLINGGTDSYIEIDTIKEHNNYVYYWTLTDATKPVWGYKSITIYMQGDCRVGRFKGLRYVGYNQSMGIGVYEDGGKKNIAVEGNLDEWRYPEPGYVDEILLNYACNYVK
jgi:hypothetical protein